MQTPDNELESAINWACGQQDVKCSMIQENQPCYQPNTTKDHADFVFNSYFQNHKNKGGNCYFNGAAIITEKDPSMYSLPPFSIFGIHLMLDISLQLV